MAGIWKKGKGRTAALGLVCAVIFLMSGCGLVTISQEKTENIDYTVLCEKELPDELLSIIEQKKEDSFKLTYEGDGYLYICQGYGRQPSAGYSIRVDHTYATGNAIYFKASLIGPSRDDSKTTLPTCPYIVIKMEHRDKTVVFG